MLRSVKTRLTLPVLLNVDDIETAAAYLVAGLCCCLWQSASTEMLLNANSASLFLVLLFALQCLSDHD